MPSIFGLFKRTQQPPAGDLPDYMNFTADLEIEAAEAPNAATPTKFKLFANSGQEPMRLVGFYDPVVIDLKGARFDKESTPVIMDHDTTHRVGHTTAGTQRIDQNGIYAEGVVSSSTDIAAGFVEDAKAGFPFQVSVGARPEEISYVEAGETATVNGKEFTGPLVIARKSLIRELSVTVLGADSKTAAIIAATSNPNSNKGVDNIMATYKSSSPTTIQAERDRIKAIRERTSNIDASWPSEIQSSIQDLPKVRRSENANA